MSASDIDILMVNMQELFRQNGVPIEFYKMCPVSFIQDNRYYELADDDERDEMYDWYYYSEAINVHIVHDAPSPGSARNPGNMMYLRNGSANTFAHEVGHNLGLEHTHNGRCLSSDDNGDCGNCFQEAVDRERLQGFCAGTANRKKCEVNGDYLCDTPADPNVSGLVNSGTPPFLICDYFGEGTDNWGDTWDPSERNIMSYSTHACRSDFTYGQTGVMLHTIENETKNGSLLFDFVSTNTPYGISGPNTVCTGNTYTYSVPSLSNVSNYNWSVPDNCTIMSGQGTTSASIRMDNWSSGTTISMTPDGCGHPGATRELSVSPYTLTVYGPPEMPDDGSFRNFSTDYHENAGTYTWSVPSGWGIASGQGTYSVQLYADPGASAGYVTVSTQICGATVTGQKYMNIGYGDGEVPAVANPGNGIELITKDQVTIYPNPATDCINLVSSDQRNIEKIEMIHLLTGMSVTCTLQPDGEIELSSLSRGIYLLRIYRDNQIITRKIIKQ